MSKKCRAYSESKLGLEPTDNRKAFYAGWDAALAQQAEPVQEPVDTHTTTLRNLLECCLSWEPDACVLGNVTARQAIAALRAALAQQDESVTEDMKSAVRWAPSSAYWSQRLRELFGPDAREGIDALERRLAEAQQAEPVKPVAWIQPDHLQKARIAPFLCRVEPTQRFADFVPLYLSPPQRKPQTLDDAMQQPQRKPLTEEEIDNICRQAHGGADPQEWARNFARAIEKAHGIGEQP